MKSYFLKQLEFDYWANSKLVAVMQTVQDLPEKPANIFSHIMAATHIWYSRLVGEPSPYAVWESFDISKWQEQLKLNHDLLSAYVQSLTDDDFEVLATYKTTSGIAYNTKVVDILSHVFWHSGYHQGQIVMLLKPYLQPLPDLNFVSFVRGK